MAKKISKKNLVGVITSLFVFAVYLYTLSPTVTFGDSGDFVTTAYELGVAHPPGYPLHAMVGHLFTKLPFGSIAWRINLMEAVFGALTVFLVYQIIYKLTKNIYASVVGSLLLGFSSTFFAYSIVADVFAMNCFFTALTIYIALLWRERHLTLTTLYLLAFLYGLSLTNHLTMALLVPAFAFLVLITDWKIILKPKTIITCILLFILGLTPYLYAPWTAGTNRPQMNWDDATTLYRFKRLLTRADYGSGNLASPTAAVSVSTASRFNQIPFFFKLLGHQFVWVGLFLGVLGLWWIFRNRKHWHLAFLPIGILFSGMAFFLYSNWAYGQSAALSAMERFSLVSDVILAILAGLGVYFLIEKIKPKLAKFPGFAFIAVGFIPLFVHFNGVNQRGDDLFYHYAKLNMDSAMGQLDLVKDGEILEKSKRIIFLTKGDILNFTTNYMQVVEKLYPDLVIMNYEMLTYDWYLDQLQERNPDLDIPFEALTSIAQLADLIDANIDNFQINIPEIDYQGVLDKYSLLVKGTNYWVLPKGYENYVLQSQYAEFNTKIFENSGFTKALRKHAPKYTEDYPHTWWEQEVTRNYSVFRSNLSEVYLSNGLYDQCLREASAAKTVLPDLVAFRIYFNLGNCYEFKKQYELALPNYLKAAGIEPTYADTYRNIALLYTNQLKDSEKAILYWEKFLELKPETEEREEVERIVRELKGTKT